MGRVRRSITGDDEVAFGEDTAIFGGDGTTPRVAAVAELNYVSFGRASKGNDKCLLN